MGFCAKCNKNGDGTYHTFLIAKIISQHSTGGTGYMETLTTTTNYRLEGEERVFICKKCVRRNHLLRIIWIIGSLSVAISLAIFLYFGPDLPGFINLVVLAVIFGCGYIVYWIIDDYILDSYRKDSGAGSIAFVHLLGKLHKQGVVNFKLFTRESWADLISKQ